MKLEPTLYMIVRTDVESMNPGKMAAQVSHATNDFELEIKANPILGMDEWRGDRSFGTCLVLEAPDGFDKIKDSLKDPYINDVLRWGSVTDPTYPVRDGKLTHLVPLETVVWVFAPFRFVELLSAVTRAGAEYWDIKHRVEVLQSLKLYK